LHFKTQDDNIPPGSSPPINRQRSPPLNEPEAFDSPPTHPRTFDDPLLERDPLIDDLKLTGQFINALRDATLEQSNMRKGDIERLRAAEPDPFLDLSDPHFVKSLRVFLSMTNSSEATYDDIRSTMLLCYPDDTFFSFGQIK